MTVQIQTYRTERDGEILVARIFDTLLPRVELFYKNERGDEHGSVIVDGREVLTRASIANDISIYTNQV